MLIKSLGITNAPEVEQYKVYLERRAAKRFVLVGRRCCSKKLLLNEEIPSIKMPHKAGGHRRNLLFGKARENLERGKL
jgi:hypothetical protein